MTSIVKRIGEKGGKESKQALMRGMEAAIRLGTPILRAFLPQRQMGVVEGVMELYVALFDDFKSHLGIPFIQETMMYKAFDLCLIKNLHRSDTGLFLRC